MQHWREWLAAWVYCRVIAYSKDFKAKGQDCCLCNSKRLLTLLISANAWQPLMSSSHIRPENMKLNTAEGETSSWACCQAKTMRFKLGEGFITSLCSAVKTGQIFKRWSPTKKCRKTNKTPRAGSSNYSWSNNAQSLKHVPKSNSSNPVS